VIKRRSWIWTYVFHAGADILILADTMELL